jgi:hypothetical protein
VLSECSVAPVTVGVAGAAVGVVDTGDDYLYTASIEEVWI